MVIGGQMSSVELFNYQTGQACSIQSLPIETSHAVGGLWDGYPVYCGGTTPLNQVSILPSL